MEGDFKGILKIPSWDDSYVTPGVKGLLSLMLNVFQLPFELESLAFGGMCPAISSSQRHSGSFICSSFPPTVSVHKNVLVCGSKWGFQCRWDAHECTSRIKSKSLAEGVYVGLVECALLKGTVSLLSEGVAWEHRWEWEKQWWHRDDLGFPKLGSESGSDVMGCTFTLKVLL